MTSVLHVVILFQDESSRLLKDWLTDVGSCLNDVSKATDENSLKRCITYEKFQIKGSRPASDALLSPHRVINTCAQYYFLYIGLLSSTASGDQLLKVSGIYPT